MFQYFSEHVSSLSNTYLICTYNIKLLMKLATHRTALIDLVFLAYTLNWTSVVSTGCMTSSVDGNTIPFTYIHHIGYDSPVNTWLHCLIYGTWKYKQFKSDVCLYSQLAYNMDFNYIHSDHTASQGITTTELHNHSWPHSFTTDHDHRASQRIKTTELHNHSWPQSFTQDEDYRASQRIKTTELHNHSWPQSFTQDEDYRASQLVTNTVHRASQVHIQWILMAQLHVDLMTSLQEDTECRPTHFHVSSQDRSSPGH